MGLSSLGLTHRFLREHVQPGAFCIDATAGNGGDTALLCGLVGESGRVLALDIQRQAVEATQTMLLTRGFSGRAQIVQDSHANLSVYAKPGTVDCITFNFGWLPGGDHSVFTKPETSIPAVEQGLALLKPGGVMSLCIYSGRENGYTERDELLKYLKWLDSTLYTVLLCSFHNRVNDPPLPVFIIKEG